LHRGINGDVGPYVSGEAIDWSVDPVIEGSRIEGDHLVSNPAVVLLAGTRLEGLQGLGEDDLLTSEN
jgi:hypothetical protein